MLSQCAGVTYVRCTMDWICVHLALCLHSVANLSFAVAATSQTAVAYYVGYPSVVSVLSVGFCVHASTYVVNTKGMDSDMAERPGISSLISK